jgi:hypothetical protein
VMKESPLDIQSHNICENLFFSRDFWAGIQ